MPANADKSHGAPACTVEVLPSEIDAGAEFAVAVHASCPHECDLTGQHVSIRNAENAELANGKLTRVDGKTYATAELTLRAPLKLGEHDYRAVLPFCETGEAAHEETSTAFSFIAKAHSADVNVWGVPSAIAAGEPFTFKVGVKCSAGCVLTGREVSIFDHDGIKVAAASLGESVWPGTTALYFAEVELRTPAEPGDYLWRVEAAGSDEGALHEAGSSTLRVKVVAPPDHEVSVEAFDGITQKPIEGIHVLLHPYRVFTDEKGVAKIRVAKGTYTLVVSGFNYIACRKMIVVEDDVTTRVELAEEPEGQEDYR